MSMSLRVKKYRISTSLGSWAMKGLAPSSWGRRMFTPKRRSRPAPSDAGGHDPRPGPGDHHPAGLGHVGGQVPGQDVDGVVGLGAGRAEHGQLADER